MITQYSRGHADDHMAEDILVELAAVVRAHPWWQARADLTLALLRQRAINPPARVLDVGCGWGVTLEALESRGYRVVGLDVSRRILEQLDRPGRTLVEADLTQPLPAGLAPFDVVLALDVLEHLDDDRQTVARLADLVAPDGHVIVSVPALPELFTEFDAIQGHRRRYLPETLQAAFLDTGLAVEQILWWGSWLVPVLSRHRARTRTGETRRLRLDPAHSLPSGQPARIQVRSGEQATEAYRRYLELPSWPLPHLLRAAFALEQGRTLRAKLRRGTSLFAVARPLRDAR
jgi:2-polyprenyl-3-methyl-5-hydroxy-6-metoxy-1,4-benzoquinol methylase